MNETDTAAEDTEPTADDNAEAAKWRRQLRQAEAERDKVTATLTAVQRSRVEAVAATHGITADALWAAGAELDDLLTDGQPDPAAIAAAVRDTREKFGIIRKPASVSGLRSGAMLPQPPVDHWRDAFAPKE